MTNVSKFCSTTHKFNGLGLQQKTLPYPHSNTRSIVFEVLKYSEEYHHWIVVIVSDGSSTLSKGLPQKQDSWRSQLMQSSNLHSAMQLVIKNSFKHYHSCKFHFVYFNLYQMPSQLIRSLGLPALNLKKLYFRCIIASIDITC